MSRAAFDKLRRFLEHDMRMSHLYQPLMLKTLLKRNGRASTRQIAGAFLAEDESQLDYYQAVTNKMPGPVLRRHGLVVSFGRWVRASRSFPTEGQRCSRPPSKAPASHICSTP